MSTPFQLSYFKMTNGVRSTFKSLIQLVINYNVLLVSMVSIGVFAKVDRENRKKTRRVITSAGKDAQ